MSCYFRHMKDILDEVDVKVTKENKKEVDQIIHGLVDEAYKNCSPAWKAVKEHIKGDDKARRLFVSKLKKAVKAI
jgi:ribosomal protein L18E